MLEFIKNLLVKKEIPIEQIKFEDLEGWITKTISKINSQLDEKISNFNKEAKEEIKSCQDSLKTLEKSQLKNPNIPLRAKQSMDGNRSEYMKRINFFLEKFTLTYHNYADLLLCIDKMESEINLLAKSTGKSYIVLQQFFSNESYAIALRIKNIDEILKKMKNLINNSKVSNAVKIKETIKVMKSSLSRKEEIIAQCKELEIDLSEVTKRSLYISQSLTQLKSSSEFADLEKLENEKLNLEREMNLIQSDFHNSISALERPLKKFSRIALENQKWIEQYLISPVKALIEDKNLIILQILNDLEKKMHDKTIGLDDKKYQKSLIEIKKLNKEFFINFFQKYNNLVKKLEITYKELQENRLKAKTSQLNKEKENVELRIENLQRRIQELNKEGEKIDFEKMIMGIQEKINLMLDKRIIVVK